MKVKITADALLKIVQAIFTDEEIDIKIKDDSLPKDWQGKKISQVLNVTYFTFKHRAASTDDLMKMLLTDPETKNLLGGVNRAFCNLSFNSIERTFSKDTDTVVTGASLTYYIQTSKLKLLEYLIETSSIATNGLRIPVQFGAETRRAVIVFDRLISNSITTATTYGEMSACTVDLDILFTTDVVTYSDYTVNFSWQDGETVSSADIPLTSFSTVDTMTQQAVPLIANRRKVGGINLSCGNSFVLVFEGYNNAFVDFIADKALSPDASENNQTYAMTVTRKGKPYLHNVVVKDHQITVNADTGNEVHTLSVVPGGS